jgi:hypothetical protein
MPSGICGKTCSGSVTGWIYATFSMRHNCRPATCAICIARSSSTASYDSAGRAKTIKPNNRYLTVYFVLLCFAAEPSLLDCTSSSHLQLCARRYSYALKYMVDC